MDPAAGLYEEKSGKTLEMLARTGGMGIVLSCGLSDDGYLSIGLVDGDGDGVGEVEAAGVRPRHGNAEQGVTVAVVEGRREPCALASEDKRVVRKEACLVEGTAAMRGEEV